jgi:uncharacterized protein (TIGR03000 family)
VGELQGTTDRAELVVELPANAKLFVDDHLMSAKSERRTFSTPTLQPDQTYYYIVRAEIVRDGMTYSSSQRVILRPGDIMQASFSDRDFAALKPLEGQITAQR